jgi:hypothetical protein
MVATGYRSQWWNITDDWEHVEGVKQSPSDISEAYPDSLEGVLIDATQELTIALDESLSITIDDSEDLSEILSDETSNSSADYPNEEDEESKRCRDAAAQVDHEEEGLSEAAVNDEERDSSDALNLVSSLKIKENIQELANAAGSKALEASVLVSSLVKEGIHIGISKIVKQLETLEAVVEQMNQPVVDNAAVSRQSVLPLEQRVVAPDRSPPSLPLAPVGCDELATVSSMGDTYVEYVRPAEQVERERTHGPRVIFEFAEKSLLQSITCKPGRRANKTPDGTTKTKLEAINGRVHAVRVRKARGRTLVRVVSPKDRSRSRTNRSKSRQKTDKRTSDPQVGAQAATAITRQKGAVQHTTSEVISPIRATPTLKSSLKQQTSLNKVKVSGTHHLDACDGFYKVKGSNSSLTTQMKNISTSKKTTVPNVSSQRQSMFRRNRRSQPAIVEE